MEYKVIQRIKRKITRAKCGEVFFVSSFPNENEEYVTKLLAQFEKEGLITRIAKGIYCKPIMTRFGPLYPDVRKIVQLVAERDHAQVLPSGATAANMLGLSEQVPMKFLFITSGSSRVLKVNGREIKLKRAVPHNFAYKTYLAALVVQALKDIGERNMGEEEISALKIAIDRNEEKEAFKADVQMMPAWMKKLIIPLL